MMGMVGKAAGNPSALRTWILRILGAAVAAYGAYAFVERGIGGYMSLQNMFVFFDFEEPLILFYIDYIAVMGLCGSGITWRRYSGGGDEEKTADAHRSYGCAEHDGVRGVWDGARAGKSVGGRSGKRRRDRTAGTGEDRLLCHGHVHDVYRIRRQCGCGALTGGRGDPQA